MDWFSRSCLAVMALALVTIAAVQVLEYRAASTVRDVNVVQSVPVEIDGTATVSGTVDVGTVKSPVEVDVANTPDVRISR